MPRFSPLLIAAFLAAPAAAHADDLNVTLRGSRASMLRQNSIAKNEEFSFLRTPAQVRRFVDDGRLVDLPGNRDYAVIAGYPYARPVVRTFIERLAASYRAACDEPLVVTSLTRPANRQPRNASPLSVHPAGMAVDLRVSRRAACSSWLRTELLVLEERGLLDATREYRPPHFHVAVFPTPYAEYDAAIVADSLAAATIRIAEEATVAGRVALAWSADDTATPEPNAESRATSLFRKIFAWVALLVPVRVLG